MFFLGVYSVICLYLFFTLGFPFAKKEDYGILSSSSYAGAIKKCYDLSAVMALLSIVFMVTVPAGSDAGEKFFLISGSSVVFALAAFMLTWFERGVMFEMREAETERMNREAQAQKMHKK